METQNEIIVDTVRNEIIDLIVGYMSPYKFEIIEVDDMEDGDEGYVIKLVNDINEEIGSINFCITNHTLYQKYGRSTSRQHPKGSEERVIQLQWLGVYPQYSGNNYGILILIYGMCIISKKYPTILYAVLDDDSDRSSNLKHNIYSKLGFTFDDPTELLSNGKVLQGGPDKTTYLGGSFWHVLYNKTNIIINKKDNVGIPLSRKSLSRKVQARKARIASKAIKASKSSKSRKAKSRKASKSRKAKARKAESKKKNK